MNCNLTSHDNNFITRNEELILRQFTTTALFAQDKKQRPNIIYIMSDDHALQAVSAYGHDVSKLAPTPNIDRITEEGIQFNQSFVTNSLCGPSRATMLTGK